MSDSEPEPSKEIRSPFAIHLGSRIQPGHEGKARCEIDVQDCLRNNQGMLHGGATFTLIDNAMGAAAKSVLKTNESAATLEIQITYMRPVQDGLLICEAEVVKRGRRMIFIKAIATLDDELVARATGTFAVTQHEC